MVDTSRFGKPESKPDTSRFGKPDTSRFGKPAAEDEGSTLGDVAYGAGTALAEPVLGLAELIPGEIGAGAAGLSKELEAGYQKRAERSPIATRAGYIPTAIGTALIPGGAALKATEGAGLLGRALATGAGAGLGAFATSPTGKELYGERIGEKTGTGLMAGGLGVLGGTIPSLYKAGKKGITAGYEALTGKAGKEAEAAGQTLKGEIAKTGAAGQESIKQQAEALTKAEFEKRARQEANLKAAQGKATSAAQQERETAAQKFSDLLPSDPRINDEATLGDAMQRRISGTESTRGNRRSQQASRDYEEYFKQAQGFEKSPAREAMLMRLKSLSESSSAGSPGRKYAAQALKDLEQSKDAKGAEIEFRKYFQEASAPQQMGFGAEEQKANQVVSDIIGEALNTHAPKRIQTRETYKEFSTPLDAYETLFGKKGVKVEAGVPGRLQMKPTDYPSTYFKDRDTVRALREQLAGDEAAMRKFGEQHVRNELQGKTGKQAQDWLGKNKAWVDEIPGLNTRVEKYVQELNRAETAAVGKEAEAAKLGAKKGEVIGARQAKEAQIASLSTDQQNKIQDQLNKLGSVKPEESTGAAQTLINTLSTLRDTEGKLIVDPEKLKTIQMQMKMVDDAYGKTKQAQEMKTAIITKALYIVLGGGGLYGTGKVISNLTKD
jgi:hypothetical protein